MGPQHHNEGAVAKGLPGAVPIKRLVAESASYFGDVVVLAPMSSEADLKEGDIVFCEVQPGDRFYCHEIHRINYEGPAGSAKYTIGNHKGMDNGWCLIEHIYGRVIEVLDVMLPFRYTPIRW